MRKEIISAFSGQEALHAGPVAREPSDEGGDAERPRLEGHGVHRGRQVHQTRADQHSREDN